MNFMIKVNGHQAIKKQKYKDEVVVSMTMCLGGHSIISKT